jgi:malate synthase
VAHPGLVPIAHEEFVKVLGDRRNQMEKKRDEVNVYAPRTSSTLSPRQPITEAGSA